MSSFEDADALHAIANCRLLFLPCRQISLTAYLSEMRSQSVLALGTDKQRHPECEERITDLAVMVHTFFMGGARNYESETARLVFCSCVVIFSYAFSR